MKTTTTKTRKTEQIVFKPIVYKVYDYPENGGTHYVQVQIKEKYLDEALVARDWQDETESDED